MPYARLDDRYSTNRKVKRALRREPAAVAFHVMAIAHCCQHETDGIIDVEEIEDWLAILPFKQAQRDRVVPVMLEVGMLEQVGDDHFRVVNFLDWNESAAERERLRAAGRAGAEARWGRRGRRGRPKAEANADSDADRIADASAVADGPPHHTTPTPTPSPPTPASGGIGNRDAQPPVEVPSSMPSLTEPRLQHTGQPRKDRAAHDAAVEQWRRDWAAWLTLPPRPGGVEAAARAMQALVAEGADRLLLGGELHAHRGDRGLLLLGLSGQQKADWVRTRAGQIIDQALDLPDGTRWQLIDCDCPTTAKEAA